MSNEPESPGKAPAREVTENTSRVDDEALADDPAVRDHPRYNQMFPVLSAAEIDSIRRFGSVSRYVKGDLLYRAGSRCPRNVRRAVRQGPDSRPRRPRPRTRDSHLHEARRIYL